MTIIRDGDAPRFGEDGVSVTGLASPSRGCATLSAWRVGSSRAPAAPSTRSRATRRSSPCAARPASRSTGPRHDLRAGDCLVVAPEREFRIRNDGPEPFEAVCCMAAGGRAVVAGEGAFVPPWAA